MILPFVANGNYACMQLVHGLAGNNYSTVQFLASGDHAMVFLTPISSLIIVANSSARA